MMLKNYFRRVIFYSALASVALASCNALTPPETIPCYIHIDKITLTTKPDNSQGSSSSNITDAWVYSDNNPVGVFQMPCTFPIVAGNGSHQLKIFPGIMQDGIASMRAEYHFYTTYTVNLNLKQDSILKISPSARYDSTWVRFHWLENFEGSGFSIKKNNLHSDTNMFKTNMGAYEGNYSGEVVLNNSFNHYEGVSDTFNLPKDGRTPVYLEFNYKSNNSFWVGMYSQTIGTQIPIVAVNPTTIWKKMYVNLQLTVNTYSNPYYIYFSVVKDNGIDTAKFMLDNIKLVQ